MKTPSWKNQNLGIYNGFRIELHFHAEDQCMRDHFINMCEWSEDEYKPIKNFYWFVAEVVAFKGSINCGSAFLGGNCYKNLKDVMQDGKPENVLGGYLPQMIEEAIEEAIENLQEHSA